MCHFDHMALVRFASNDSGRKPICLRPEEASGGFDWQLGAFCRSSRLLDCHTLLLEQLFVDVVEDRVAAGNDEEG